MATTPSDPVPHHATEPPPRKWRWWIPITVCLAVAATLTWLYATEHTFRTHALQILSGIGAFLIILWYLFLSGLPKRRKWVLSSVLLALCISAATAAALGWVRPKLADGSGWYTLEFGPRNQPDDLPDISPTGAARVPSEPLRSSGAEARFLGPKGDGSVPGPALETDWTTSPPVEIWRRRLGPGWSSFAISQGKAVTLEQRDADELTVCYDLESGDPLWASKNAARFDDPMGGPGPRATPTIADGRVFSLGATGLLTCLDLLTGEKLWQRDVLRDFNSKNLSYGISAAPLISGDHVVVTGGDSAPTLIALNRTDGTTAWTSGSDSASYASPVLATLGGIPQILSVNSASLTGHDPGSGDELWNFKWEGGFPKVGQPVAVDGSHVLITAAYNMGTFLVEIKATPDGSWQASQIWRSERLKTKFSSALIHGAFAYGIDSGTFTCISLEDGTRVWKDGRYGFGQNLLVGDTILIQAERGDLVLVAADPTAHRELARFPALDARSWAAPALAGDFLLVRSQEEAACFRIQRRPAPQNPIP